MAVFKCKMCGGALNVNEGMSVCECSYCGTKQTLSTTDDEQNINMINRANHFRQQCKFDTAMEIYERLLNNSDGDAEIYWSIVLCRYGIEYVDDPQTKKKIPTCHRTQFKSILDDADYLTAIDRADAVQKPVYEAEAKYIDTIQKGILEISNKEEPFDVFICYKESDANGKRTPDSVLAQELYYQLIREGFKVFFSRITLEGKLGTSYEPYIFAALNSAKVMVVVGTKPEFFNAVWVKNEWSRYLMLMQEDRSRILIPAFRDMDPYDLPEELSMFQAQDMSKLGFMQDLIHGIQKIAKNEPNQTVIKETVVQSGNTNTAPLLKRAFLFLEDGDWVNANTYCEKVLDLDPECAEAYLGKLLAELKVRRIEDLPEKWDDFSGMDNYKKACRFGDDKLKKQISDYNKQGIYNGAVNIMNLAKTETDFKQAGSIFAGLGDFSDAGQKAEKCLEGAENARKEALYQLAKTNQNSDDIEKLERAIRVYESIVNYKDSSVQIEKCHARINEINAENERQKEELERQAEIAREEAARATKRRSKRNKIIAAIAGITAAASVAFVIVLNKVIIPNNKYNKAMDLYNSGKYEEAISAFEAMNGYKDSDDMIIESNYNKAMDLYNSGKYSEAMLIFKALDGHKDSQQKASEISKKISENLSKVIETLPCDTISAGGFHTTGLKSDGTVVAAGYNYYNQCDIEGWTDIVAVSAGVHHTVGLKSDGTVVAVGNNNNGQCDVSDWTDIVAVSASYDHTVGLKSDGTVVAVGNNEYGQCDISDWTDIVAVSAGDDYTFGLKSDGTVVAVGDKRIYGRHGTSDWTDIVAVSASKFHTVGLKSDGTVVAVGYDTYGRCDVSDWTDIVAVSVGEYHTVGLKSNGTVVSVGDNEYGQCDTSDWTDIKTTK